MGEVYRAHQTNLNRDVAIKVISRQWLKSIVGDDEELQTALQRFTREVHAMGRIKHPNVSFIVNESNTPDLPVDINIKEPILTEDNATLRYVSGGTLTLSDKK
jgi:serine/threonine-protein kinase